MASRKKSEPVKPTGEPTVLVDPETGEQFTVWGYGSMKGMLDLDPRIDMTKPIGEQVERLLKLDRRRAKRRELQQTEHAA